VTIGPRISVIIPVRNEATRIARCLTAVHNQTLRPAEIIVVDGHSADRTVEIAQQFGARVSFEDDATRAGACQVGVDAAESEFVAFTDADCEPDPRWLENLVAGFSDGVVGVGGQIANEGDTFWQRSIDVTMGTLLGSGNSVQGRAFRGRRHVSSISGCNSMYRKADLLAVGGFRRDLVTTEDTELNRRLLQRGKLLYVPDALVHHRHGRGLRDFARRMFQYGYGRGQSLLLGPPLAISVAAPAFVTLSFLQPWYALLLLGAYLLLLIASAIGPAVRRREPRLLAAVPLICLIEHTCYAAGFWKGVLRTRGLRGGRAAAARRHGL